MSPLVREVCSGDKPVATSGGNLARAHLHLTALLLLVHVSLQSISRLRDSASGDRKTLIDHNLLRLLSPMSTNNFVLLFASMCYITSSSSFACINLCIFLRSFIACLVYLAVLLLHYYIIATSGLLCGSLASILIFLQSTRVVLNRARGREPTQHTRFGHEGRSCRP